MSEKLEKLIKRSQDPKLIRGAFEFAKKAYEDKYRASGENYIFHAIRVASELDRMNLDSSTIALGFLHDVIDDIPASTRKIELREIKKMFGEDIGELVEKISNLARVRYSLSVNIENKKALTREKIENLRRMFMALSGDLRVILVELVSRLDGLKFLNFLPEDKQKMFAMETLQIFVPVARRLGLSELRRELEDSAFSYLFPEKFKWAEKNIEEKYEERKKYLKNFIPRLKKILKKEKVRVLDINYRTKSYWSTYKKLFKHGMDFNKIHDLLALRIITPDIESCYKALGLMHKYFKPISEEIDDYIAKPKSNGYRSLHTTVFLPDNKITEVQIRTREMHEEAEYGICAHWSYKEGVDLQKEGESFNWMKNTPNFWKTFKIDFFSNKVFSFTPKGDVVVLPRGSTPVDFAYAVHSDIGNHCEGAKIGGLMVPLNRTIENGDVVEITTNKNKTPSRDWLKFVKTPLAKSNIKKLTRTKTFFNIPLPGFIKRKIIEISEASKKKKEEKQKIRKEKISHICIAGNKGMLVHIAKCCNPQPGDKVGAYLAPNRATVLHRMSCRNFKKISEKFPDKIIEASWN